MVRERAQGRARDKLLYGRRTRVQVRGEHKTLSMASGHPGWRASTRMGQLASGCCPQTRQGMGWTGDTAGLKHMAEGWAVASTGRL